MHNCSISTVSRLVKQQREQGSNRLAPHPGRYYKVQGRSERHIGRLIRQHRFATTRQLLALIQDAGISISLSSLRRLMKRLKYHRRIARLKPLLTERVRSLRYDYAFKHRLDDLNDWRRTIYTDEAALRLDGSLKVHVTRKDGEAYNQDCMLPRLFAARTMCMIWAAIWHGGRSQLFQFNTSESEGARGGVTAVLYRDQITRGELKRAWGRVNTSWRAYGGARILEDNAPIHTSVTSRSAGLAQRFKYLQHPPSSPDLNPIENCWAMLKRKWARCHRRPSTVNGMMERLEELWQEIPQSAIDRTIDSMPKRLLEVRKSRGWATKY